VNCRCASDINKVNVNQTASQGRSRRMRLDGIKEWTQLNTYVDINSLKDWLMIDVNGELVLRHINLLIQKTTADDKGVYLLFWLRICLRFTSRLVVWVCTWLYRLISCLCGIYGI